MVTGKVTIVDETGLHLRPAGILCQEACKFTSKIEFTTAKGKYNAKSILSVLGACVKKGDEIELICDGEDEQVALDELVTLIKGELGKDFRIKED